MSFKFYIALFCLASCSMGVVKNGGDRSYQYDVYSDYSTDDLRQLSPLVVSSSLRDPQMSTHSQLFSENQKPIKRIGILVFESVIQETRSGLSGEDKVYLSEQGKQLLTERLLSIWDQSFPLLGSELVYVSTKKLRKSKSLKLYGSEVTDYVKIKRHSLGPDDIFYLPPGKLTPTATLMNARGMRDLSLALVSASELMQGPKYSEHMKHAVIDVSKELGLDAVIVVYNNIFWTASHLDKKTGDLLPEQVSFNLSSSILIPMNQYHERLNNLGLTRDLPRTTIAFKTYDAKLQIPVLLTVSEQEQTFHHIESELLDPVIKTYKDLSQMIMLRMLNDLKGSAR